LLQVFNLLEKFDLLPEFVVAREEGYGVTSNTEPWVAT
jgi:hypothetical protein